MGIKQVSQLALGVSGLLGVLAACSDSADQTSVSVSDSTSKANVSIGVYNAQGKQTASCAGTLIGPTTVLTAGHCVTGGAKWQVTAPQVSGDAVTGYRAVSYDWQNFQSTLSHRFHVDIGVVILEKPIALDHYPTLSSTPIDGSEALVRVRRTDTSSPRTTFEGVSGDVSLGTSKGFAFDYLGSVGGGETIDTGGALIDTRTNIIYGVVSGKGDQTGMMHVARIDVMGKWLSSKLQCHNNRPVAMTTQCHPGSSSGGTTGSSSGSSGASCGSSGGTSSSGGSSGSSGTN